MKKRKLYDIVSSKIFGGSFIGDINVRLIIQMQRYINIELDPLERRSNNNSLCLIGLCTVVVALACSNHSLLNKLEFKKIGRAHV